MLKKNILFTCLLFSVSNVSFAAELPVKVDAISKISTANVSLQEGDDINFVVENDVFVNSKLYIKKGANVSGVITKLVDNGFTCQEASIYAENFRVEDKDGNNIKLDGIVFKQGRNHSLFTQFLPVGYEFIRGGEAQIIPGKDAFTLYVEGNLNDDL